MRRSKMSIRGRRGGGGRRDMSYSFMWVNIRHLNLYVPMFQNTVSVPSS